MLTDEITSVTADLLSLFRVVSVVLVSGLSLAFICRLVLCFSKGSDDKSGNDLSDSHSVERHSQYSLPEFREDNPKYKVKTRGMFW